MAMDGEDHAMNGAQSPAPASTGKSIWFWLALAFSLVLAWHGSSLCFYGSENQCQCM